MRTPGSYKLRSLRKSSAVIEAVFLSLPVIRHPKSALHTSEVRTLPLCGKCQECTMPPCKLLRVLQTSLFWKTIAFLLISYATTAAAFSQTFTLLYSFTGGADGGSPSEGLVLDSAGTLYGTTQHGGTGTCTQYGLSGCGTVFKVTNQQTEAVLYSFKGAAGGTGEGSDGEYPWGGLALDAKGNLYGTTVGGGIGFGVLFSLTPHGSERILHRFMNGTDGAYPSATLTLDRAGNLYGTTTSGGSSSCGYQNEGCGTLFEKHLNSGSVLHAFAGAPDGSGPGYGGVLIDNAGNLYGTTGGGGAANAGTVYKIDRAGNYSVLYSFTGGLDGCEPLGTLAADESGNLYGTASACGAYSSGTLFKINAAGSLTLLYAFGATGSGIGKVPMGGVVRDRNGNLYGTTLFGGNCSLTLGGCGTIFKVTQAGISLLYSLDGYTDGSSPWCNVILDSDGNLYGTTTIGGLGGQGAGTVWKVTP